MANDFLDKHRYVLMALLSGLILVGSGVSLGVGLVEVREAEVGGSSLTNSGSAEEAEVSEFTEINKASNQPVDQSANRLTNINTASADELDLLPGIGPAYAQRIIDYREGSGLFKATSEIQNVSGIGPKTFEKLKDLITVR